MTSNHHSLSSCSQIIDSAAPVLLFINILFHSMCNDIWEGSFWLLNTWKVSAIYLSQLLTYLVQLHNMLYALSHYLLHCLVFPALLINSPLATFLINSLRLCFHAPFKLTGPDSQFLFNSLRLHSYGPLKFNGATSHLSLVIHWALFPTLPVPHSQALYKLIGVLFYAPFKLSITPLPTLLLYSLRPIFLWGPCIR